MIKTAVILAAGLNSRMYPIARVIPKAMLPLGTIPAIHILAKECKESGIKRIVVVQRKGERLIEDYFKKNNWKRTWLKRLGKKQALQWLKEIESLKVRCVEQSAPLGEAHALKQALPVIRGEKAIAVLFGDIIYKSKKPALKQLINEFERKKVAVISSGRFILVKTQLKSLQGKVAEGKTVASLFEKESDFFNFKVKGKMYGLGNLAEYKRAFAKLSQPL